MATKAPASTQSVHVVRTVSARIPTIEGEFQLCYYANARDDKEHLALVYGDVTGGESVPVRVHSECFTGDVLGSRRCDCGDQLHYAMAYIATAGRGVVIYLRQEGRGIGLEHKLQAYNLQDEGYDTVEANLLLGHQADEREYWAASAILSDLQIRSVQLLTNNPAKIEHLRELGVDVVARLPVLVEVNEDNRAYLETKAQRMRHILDFSEETAQPTSQDQVDHAEPFPPKLSDAAGTRLEALQRRIAAHHSGRPFVTLTYAQSLNGAIGGPGGTPAQISGPEAMLISHQLRAAHDAILVGVGTVIADNPHLTVRLVDGRQPQPVVVDSSLRTPTSAHLISGRKGALIATVAANKGSARARALEAAGATLLYLPSNVPERLGLQELLDALAARGLHSVLVEGGAQIINSFLTERLVDALVVTVAPRLLAGISAVAGASANGTAPPLPELVETVWTAVGDDLILWGAPARES